MNAVLESTDSAVRQRAAAGHFRAIALWLNQPLVPQQVYAQVQADRRPGCLQILVEFERPPQPERLVRFVCSRICQLQSALIEGIHVIARPVGQADILWQRRVRIRQQTRPANPAGGSTVARPKARSAWLSLVEYRPAGPSLYAAFRRLVRDQFKFFRAAVLSGAAATAFLLGCLTELMLSAEQSAATAEKATPAVTDWATEETRATHVAFSHDAAASSEPTAERSSIVEAALEPVAVIPYDEVLHPDDPTVTLLFGGEVSLEELASITPSRARSQRVPILANIEAYQLADVAMVGLGDPLATAGTSLQEEFHNRGRPQAVTALKAGGVDIVGINSDRALDYGEQGLAETLDTLDQAGIYRVGAGRDGREARRPEILDVKGQRVAYLSYSPDSPIAAQAGKGGVNDQAQAQVIADIQALRHQVDWVIVNYRWRGELAATPADWQTDLARASVDAGADLVVGYHASQLQGGEIYQDRPIVYSLGDFIFADAPLDDHDTAALKVLLRHRQMKLEFIPISVRDAQPQTATGKQAEGILQQIRQASESFPQPLAFPKIFDAKSYPAPAELPVWSEEPTDFSEHPDNQDFPRGFSERDFTPPSEADSWPSTSWEQGASTPSPWDDGEFQSEFQTEPQAEAGAERQAESWPDFQPETEAIPQAESADGFSTAAPGLANAYPELPDWGPKPSGQGEATAEPYPPAAVDAWQDNLPETWPEISPETSPLRGPSPALYGLSEDSPIDEPTGGAGSAVNAIEDPSEEISTDIFEEPPRSGWGLFKRRP